MAAKKKIEEKKEIDKADVKAGMIVRVHQKITDVNAKGEEKERVQVYEGLVIARRHGTEPGATITVRKMSDGIGVEKIFPINSPIVEKIELVDEKVVRRAKLHFARSYKKRLKSKSEKEELKRLVEARKKKA
jgi:large subunit ribosomal protein L19